MKAKKISSLILSLMLCFLSWDAALGAVYEDNFIPACKPGSILTERGIKYYRVKAGDTLWDIAMRSGVDVKIIMAVNNMDEKSILAVGQVISIPYTNTRVHVIKPGETMWDIARRYDISLDALIKANPGKNPQLLKIGDSLKIPDDSLGSSVVLQEQPSRSVSFRSLSYAWPLVGTITSAYGWRQSGFHHGIDIAGSRGEPIRAAADGTVVFSGYKPVYGKMVVLRHADGRETVYAHAHSLKVSEGEKVKKGQIIATVGTTGRTTGPHVHFEVREEGKTVNPLKFLRY
ncbi:Murein DD-endopeptidase MepM and murein hydrolase activator NlpD, contain LysM domain [Thermosyntropha lipolytica DSM 11003]|uniref:Murein DD-endopeptidase MepM and murein hydrolase activator NlpD, contain LysM domain n=1 Tax=Thermosyntropha lipolytica DSM 11003 TaxID=1123382 RepID=A0A1M5RWB8_9FIRM|nr:M23 family metallopeptidase [Thermosyntropha lipolytica]SHH30093.1 Murein DD-endopeptidase MepM and murein hydrolase activator NlpD, contain LysM domain [Thermosyntropha lipolytica DSM 11003]